MTVLIGIGERIGLFSNQMIGWIFMALSLAIYVIIGVLTRTSNPDQYYVAGRGVPSIYNGMATGSDWMSAASFISMAGLISTLGFFGLGYVMGWTGGYLLLAVLLGPYLRQFGAYTIPDFLGARYGGNTARVVGVVGAIICSFTYLTAQVTGVGLIVARFIGIDYNIGVFVGLVGVLFCSVLGGMKSVTWTQVAQYIILIISYLVPVVYLSWTLFSIPIPELTYGRLLQQNNATELRLTADAKEKETRALWKKDADDIAAKIKAGGLPESEVEKLQAQQRTALAQARPLAASETAKFGNTLTAPSGVGHVELPRPDLLPHGRHGRVAAHPHPVLHDAVGEGGAHLGRLVALLHLPALLHGAGLRGVRAVHHVHASSWGAKISELPGWVTLWQPAGLFSVVDKNGDGVVQWADFVDPLDRLRGALDAGDRRAAVRDHRPRDGGRVWPPRYRPPTGFCSPSPTRSRTTSTTTSSTPRRRWRSSAHDHQGPARGHRAHLGLHCDLPAGDHRRAGGLGLQPGRGLLLPGAGHGYLVEARQQDRARAGAWSPASR